MGSEGANARRLFQECRRRHITTALDLECADLTDESGLHALLAETDVLLAPARDAEEVAHTASLPDAARSLLALGPSLVAITRGGRGCLVATSDQMLDVPGRSVPVVDTTGAGDCFAGAFLYGFVQGWSARDCAEVATLMAAQSVTAYGCRGRLLSLTTPTEEAPDRQSTTRSNSDETNRRRSNSGETRQTSMRQVTADRREAVSQPRPRPGPKTLPPRDMA